MKNKLRLIVLFLIFINLVTCSEAQVIQSVGDSVHQNHLSFFGSLQVYTHTNGGLFYKLDDFAEKNSVLEKELENFMMSFSLGTQYRSVFQAFEFAYKNSDGIYQLDFGNDALTTKYFSYQIWFDSRDIPVSPFISLNLSYVIKNYEFLESGEWGGGNTYSRDYHDASKTFLIQLPIGISLYQKKSFLIISYYFPIYAWINGSFQDNQQGFSYVGGTWSIYNSGNYSGNSESNNYEKQKGIFGIRLGVLF